MQSFVRENEAFFPLILLDSFGKYFAEFMKDKANQENLLDQPSTVLIIWSYEGCDSKILLQRKIFLWKVEVNL